MSDQKLTAGLMDGVDRSRKNALVSGSKRRSKQRFEEEHTERVSGNQRGDDDEM